MYSEYYAAIDEIRALLKIDLIGVPEENEIIEGVEPLNRYACGILWPMRTSSSLNDDGKDNTTPQDYEEPEDTLQSGDDSLSNANIYQPTSMGISIMLPTYAENLSVSFKGAKYKREEADIDGTSVHRYVRTPYVIKTDVLIHNKIGTKRVIDNKELGIEIALSIRSITAAGKLITVTVQNTAHARQKNIEQNENAHFQCELALSADVPLLPVYQNAPVIADIEEQLGRLQYRDVKNYAYGHGCSVSYKEVSGDVLAVESDFLPAEQVCQMKPGAVNQKDILKIAYWKNPPREFSCDKLLLFVDEYMAWREKQVAKVEPLPDFNSAGKIVLARIDECIDRLKNGILTLRSDDFAWEAFKLMNEAMLLQRIKTKQIKESDAAWYPFQLAYILQIIPDIVNKDSRFRNTVDLLWFPTGGGKTEAYLGVAAFVIFYRRLSGGITSDGVTIIMRYTLRLLTIQQFERATALICACEYLRRRERNLSPGEEISIGLWIGSSMTPNNIKQAKDALDKLKDNPLEKIYEGNPVQITKCPWCGHKIDLNGYDTAKDTLRIKCADNMKCEFHHGLPIYVVDDDIYKARPTLLLSTVDKFARITWEESAGRLFGEHCPPPELIIQDELHLISGPLGSLAGIYEIALEYLCEISGKNPKIIASTATVKNAREQIRNLYNKETIQFPPSGIDYSDSFFAVKAEADERPARTYIGLCEMGGSTADLMIRVYAVLLFAKTLFVKQEKDSGVIDQFFTTVGYFNALKNLGESSTIIQDRVYTHIRNLVSSTFKAEAGKHSLTFSDIRSFEHSELTSRKSSKEIKDTLDRLELTYKNPACYSYVLASNMLSVGIDIDRLGVMTVYNQPKSNAEYIQATSRVGRRNPGMVLVMYNNMRSRDKSHYEQFGYYHKSFYRYVEATSVTPFSARAIEKALHCVFVALVRLTVPGLVSNEAARYFQADATEVGSIIKYLVKRVEDVMPDKSDFAAKTLREFAKNWEDVASENSHTLYYKSYSGSPSLLSSAEEGSALGLPTILNSLRNVDPSVNVFFRK